MKLAFFTLTSLLIANNILATECSVFTLDRLERTTSERKVIFSAFSENELRGELTIDNFSDYGGKEVHVYIQVSETQKESKEGNDPFMGVRVKHGETVLLTNLSAGPSRNYMSQVKLPSGHEYLVIDCGVK